MDGTILRDPPADLRPEIELLKIAVTTGYEPVSEDALAEALPSMTPEQIREALLVRDVARLVPEGWVLKGHGPKTKSSRWRLLLR